MNAIKPQIDVAAMYEMWLTGLSIRNIGKHVGIGRMSVHSTLTKHYGKDACNLRKQSLSRVVYQEYGDMELATAARGSNGLFRTARAEKNYSKHQTYDCVTVNLAYEVPDTETELLLPLYIWFSEYITVMLSDMVYEVN